MRTYIDALKEVAVEAKRQHDEAMANLHRADPRVLCDKQLTVQIEELMRSLSPAQRDRLWSMDELAARLQAKQIQGWPDTRCTTSPERSALP